MHEWALAEGVVAAVSRIAEEQGLRRVTEVTVRIGELQQVDREILIFAIDQLRTPVMGDARIIVEEAPARLRCRVCSHTWRFDPEGLGEEVSEAIHFVPEVVHAYLRCPGCGSPDFEVVEGRGIWLASVKGLRGDG
ncbi:MAG: hydrogenase nickel incorporation protein HypA [Candidatus Bathyarchaeota archaeon B23]|nr:MAG: hydrogenase nickel incorporation protein HypA [Candidatus Bathyarchaeota archaeon B23]